MALSIIVVFKVAYCLLFVWTCICFYWQWSPTQPHSFKANPLLIIVLIINLLGNTITPVVQLGSKKYLYKMASKKESNGAFNFEIKESARKGITHNVSLYLQSELKTIEQKASVFTMILEHLWYHAFWPCTRGCA